MYESTIYLITLIELFVHIDREKHSLFLITLIELFVQIDREKHSLRVLTPRETTKDKLENMLVSKSQAIG